MELYLFFAFLLLYVVTSFILSKNMLRKIWTLAFIFAFIVTSIALGFVRLGRQDVMMDANQLNWYYILFLFGMVAIVLGIFNVWMYRKPLWRIIFSSGDDDDGSIDDK